MPPPQLVTELTRGGGADQALVTMGVVTQEVINAAFCHAHPLGARFSGPDRGAWYAGFELATGLSVNVVAPADAAAALRAVW